MKNLIKSLAFGFLSLLAVTAFIQVAFAQNDSCVALSSKNLSYGARDSGTDGEVSLLQGFLQSNNYLNSAPTGFFGKLTLSAVKRFQSSNRIPSVGYVGPLTRTAINNLSCNNSSGSDQYPTQYQYEDHTQLPVNTTAPIMPSGYQIPTTQNTNSVQNQAQAPDFPIIPSTTNNTTSSATASITLLSPNGGETISKNRPFDITWSTTGVSASAYVSIDIITPTNVVNHVAVNAPNTGTYTWSLNETLEAGHYKMLIRTFANNAPVQAYSNNYFSITSTSNLSVSLDPSTPPTQSHPVSNTAGAPNIPLAAFTLNSTSGDSVLKTFQVHVDSSNGNIGDNSVSTVYLYSGPTLLASAPQSYGFANFSNLNFLLSKDISQTLTVTGDYPPFYASGTSTVWIVSPIATYSKPDGALGVTSTSLSANKQTFYPTSYVPTF